ncbi:uncharacterized protein UDID_11647 [Ustilago sp. UG-2017a]|nr:uncharacterized protein UDID_11647 [Ustilago sp. UG-2017a]SPC65843.1 uncharacterized protein UHOD_11647 [Ustilago sp. UG-2017b]
MRDCEQTLLEIEKEPVNLAKPERQTRTADAPQGSTRFEQGHLAATDGFEAQDHTLTHRPNRTATAGSILFTIKKTHTSTPTNLLGSFSTLAISTSIPGAGTLIISLPGPVHQSSILACV